MKFVLLSCTMLLAAAVSPVVADDTVEFSRDIRPILTKNCLECHGFDAESRMADLRLDTFDGATRKNKEGHAAIVPGNIKASALIERVSSDDDATRMPPPKTKKRLTAEQIDLLRKWIAQGAQWEDHWSFREMNKPAVPDVSKEDESRVRTPIDAFILSRLRANGLKPSSEADRRTLVRRVYFDLVGLSPTPEQLQAHIHDTRADWYEQMVEQLLASPRYGERWARHWLDVAHYADSHGYDKDKVRPNAWPYRDYVIRSLNEDKNYGRFIKEQIAGDVLWPNERDGVVGTGFIAAGPFDWVGQIEVGNGTMEKKQVRNLDRDDMVSTAMNVFASLTVQCARCHDHKFDPITQKDYYSLQSIFAAIDRADRPYPVDNELNKRRLALQEQKEALHAQLNEINKQLITRGGHELAKIDAEIKQLRQITPTLPPQYGYHSQFAARAETPKWVQVDLGRSIPISEIQLIPAFDNYGNIGAGFGFPVRFRVEISDDELFASGVEVIRDETKSDFPNPLTSPVVIKPEKPITARYVRVTAAKLALRVDTHIFALGELRVMNDGRENLALKKKVLAIDSIEMPARWEKANLVDGIYYQDGESLKPRIAALTKQRTGLLKEKGIASLAERAEALAVEITQIDNEITGLPRQPMVYAAATHFQSVGNHVPTKGKPRDVYLLKRGSENAPDKDLGLMKPSAIDALSQLRHHFDLAADHGEGDRRVALANWLTDHNNPLTWRSIVNRVWHHHFDRGIVDTPNDFGQMGGVPTHPQLLDWLAVEFRDTGQSIKQLHRLIVNSSTYRQTSSGNSYNESIDSGNQLLWRMNRRKLTAEAVRDKTLQAAGNLDLTMGGPGYFVFGFKNDHSPHYKYHEYDPTDKKTHRRAIYRFIVRSAPDPFMTTMDCADPSLIVADRNDTLTALQALALMNNRFMVQMSKDFAERVAAKHDEPSAQINHAYMLALGRKATADEEKLMVNIAREHGLANACRLILNLNEFMFVD